MALRTVAVTMGTGAILASEPCGVKGHAAGGVHLRIACELVLEEKSLPLLN